MIQNNTKAYEMYLDDIHQATGSTKMLADHIKTSRQTLERYLYEGNDKGYTFEHIGKYAQIYALYNKDIFMMTGTLDELSTATGMQMKQLKWFRTPTAEKRNGTYQVVKLEGDFEVIRSTEIKWKEKVYEVMRDKKFYTGTPSEISEQMDVGKGYAASLGTHIGTRWARLKAVDLETMETFYGNRAEVAEFIGRSESGVMQIARKSGGKTPWHEVEFTGKYDVELFSQNKPETKKPDAGYQSVKPVYANKPVPMSEYGKQLFEWSTRHLRRDA